MILLFVASLKKDIEEKTYCIWIKDMGVFISHKMTPYTCMLISSTIAAIRWSFSSKTFAQSGSIL